MKVSSRRWKVVRRGFEEGLTNQRWRKRVAEACRSTNCAPTCQNLPTNADQGQVHETTRIASMVSSQHVAHGMRSLIEHRLTACNKHKIGFPRRQAISNLSINLECIFKDPWLSQALFFCKALRRFLGT